MAKNRRRLASFLSGMMLCSILLPAGQGLAAVPGATASTGQIVDKRVVEIGPGATYQWMNMKLDRGPEKLHFVEFDPKNAALELQAGKTGGKVYGMQGVSQMAADADRTGNRVIAAVNGDFYDMSTGIPSGLFMGEGEILASPPADWYAFGIKADGTSLYGRSPKLTRTLAFGGQSSPLTEINRLRGTESLVLYTPEFHTSTMTNDLGDEVVLDVTGGAVQSGQTLAMKVSEVHKNKGNTPLAPNQVVLSASGKFRDTLAPLKPGDDVTASFTLEGEWKDVRVAIGGSGLLVKDGAAQPNSDPAAHPRTAVGTKADGSVILLEIDGRQPGFSEGVDLTELGRLMKDLGAVNALNLDGGGSSTFVARMPGEKTRKILNTPSDGGERKTANGLLLVNKAPEGAADKLVVQPQTERVLTGSSAAFKAAAVDANLHPAPFNGTPQWSADPAVGTFAPDGTFTAGSKAGEAVINAASGGLTGTGKVEVVEDLTELKFADAVKTFTSGSSETLKITALRDGQVVQADNSRIEWRTEGPIGSIDAAGVFTATAETEKTGKIYAKYKNVETSLDVHVGVPPVILEDFENGLDRYNPSAGAQFKSTNVSIETDEEFVRFGKNSLKLAYDFTGMPGTSGAYLQVKSGAQPIQIPGYPEKISMWVYGDGNKHWLRAQMRDGKGAVALDFVDQTVGVDFKGWKYLEAVVPKGRTLPLTMDMPVRYMETSSAKKDAGAIYVDQIRALYGPAQDDMDPPVLKNFSPADGETIKSNLPTIKVYGEDYGYDPAKHPGTTLIDPDKIRFYLDGTLVQHTLYPPEGRIYYTPGTPLADGIHQAKVSVRDLSGNQTTKEWTFNVDTGSAKIVYDTPKEVYAGGTYSLDVKGIKAASIKNGRIDFAFDPGKVENIRLVRGPKLSDTQLTADIDGAAGLVSLKMQELQTASLTDQDIIGQIQYDIRKDATGTNLIAFKSGSVSFANTGDTSFSFFGLPLSSEIKNQLKLEWNDYGNVQGYETEFVVKDERGAAVEGAGVLADGSSIGTTDAQGKLRTQALTSAVNSYKLQAAKGNSYSAVSVFAVSPLGGSETPYNIGVNMGSDPASSRAFIWHTNPGTEPTVVELVKQSEFTDFQAGSVKRITGDSSLYSTLDIGTIRIHKAVAEGLEPGTSYVYRVGDGKGHTSKQGTFKTTELAGDRTKFLYFADSQAGDQAGFNLWGNTVKKAVADNPDAEFMVHAGDMVDKGFNEKEWNMWFGAAQDAFLNTTLVGTIGNHEVMGTRENSDFLAHFNQPGTGLDSLKGSSFSYDYKDVHFVVLNSEYQYEEQKEWLKRDLAKTNKKWKVAIFHRGPYGSIYDTAEIRSLWAPALEENKVDLVLNGHDHIYLRTYPMKNNQIATDGQGTTYVVAGSSGPKFYPVTKRDWQRVIDEEQTQMYASIDIAGDELKFVTKTVGGRVVDEFSLYKKEVPPASVEIEQQNLKLAVGESVKLTAAVKPADATDRSVTWSVYSSTPSGAVTVTADGTVKAAGLGSAVIRATSATAPDVYGETTVTVDRLPSGQLASIELSGKGSLKVGESDQTVTRAVYTDNSRFDLTDGVTYSSSRPSVAQIDTHGAVKALTEGTTVLSAVYGGFTAQYELTVKASGSGGSDGGSGGGSGGDNGGGTPTVPTIPPVEPPVKPQPGSAGKLAATAAELAAMKAAGAVTFVTSAPFEELALPGNAGELLGDAAVRVEAGNVAVTLPAAVLRELGELMPAAEREGSTLKLGAVRIAGEDARRLLASASAASGARLAAGSDLLELRLTVTTKDGKTSELTRFAKPVTIELPAGSGVDARLAGIYGIAGSGALEYAGGTWRLGKLTADVNHLGTYAVLEYGKAYADVPADHWAAGVIEELTARHLIDGMTGNTFAPERKVTRAEFTAMLVRLLNLKAEGVPSFSDVSGQDWYAGAVAAASKAGLVNGVNASEFAPEAVIKRQEMAAMIVRAYEVAAGKKAAAGEPVRFADVEASPVWVREAVDAASSLGLVNGRTAGGFEPEGTATRAESVQVTANLLKKLGGVTR
ncbi:phosphodiester glycosidase family protein [Paenibacillus sp. GbtcB18]|uniref:phosphodiester glycosidase family protein n=1 Tax=Paenibacillus sp. GbtcB18 TaxID=2824763 RepID=UPI001C30E78A|nr:phosphodiester glycosidase family protein [Paenibacillus sp. GbtcB18]